MNILIAYDINVERHSELKSKLLEASFSDVWHDSNHVLHNLPDTTLWIANVMNNAHAKVIFDKAIDELNDGKSSDEIIKPTRFVAVQMGVTLGIPGHPHA